VPGTAIDEKMLRESLGLRIREGYERSVPTILTILAAYLTLSSHRVSAGINLDALTAGTIGHPFMEVSAKAANPDSQNGERQAMLAIAKMGLLFNLVCQSASAANLTDLTSAADSLDALGPGNTSSSKS
jgi:hypothetical protein